MIAIHQVKRLTPHILPTHCIYVSHDYDNYFTIISLNNINCLVLVTETRFIHRAVGS